MRDKMLFLRFLGANAGFAVTQAVVLVVVARLAGQRDLGFFLLSLSVCTPISVFFNYSLRLILATDYEKKYTFEKVIWLKLALSASAIILSVLLTCAFDAYFSGWRVMFILVLIYKLQEGFIEALIGWYQRDSGFVDISNIYAAKTFSYFLSFIIGLMLSNSIEGALVLAIAGQAAVALVWRPNRVTNASIQEVGGGSAGIIREGLPLAGAALLMSLNLNIPRIGFEGVFGPDAFAALVAALQFLVPGTLLILASTQFELPALSAAKAEGDREGFYRIYSKLMLISAALAVFYFVFYSFFATEVVRLVYGLEFPYEEKGVAPYIAVFAIPSLFLNFLNLALVAAGLGGTRFMSAGLATCASLAVVFVAHKTAISPQLLLVAFGGVAFGQVVFMSSVLAVRVARTFERFR